MVFIYALLLHSNKYYIGKTNNPNFRIENHFSSNGSEWTTKYKPITVIELIPNCDDYDEDKYTKIYMDKYGIDNVRGGSFVSVKLEQSTINILKHMNNGTNDNCFKCGKKGHFVNECLVENYDNDINYKKYRSVFDMFDNNHYRLFYETSLKHTLDVNPLMKFIKVDDDIYQIRNARKTLYGKNGFDEFQNIMIDELFMTNDLEYETKIKKTLNISHDKFLKLHQYLSSGQYKNHMFIIYDDHLYHQSCYNKCLDIHILSTNINDYPHNERKCIITELLTQI